MSHNISYEGDFSCRLANVEYRDDDALSAATEELMDPNSRVVGVRVKDFMTPDEIAATVDATRRITKRWIESASLVNELKTLGVAQQSRRYPPQYMETAESWRQNAAFMEIAGPDAPIIRRMVTTLETAYRMPANPAQEDGVDLLPATLRCIDFAETHTDIIASKEEWAISHLQNDIAWNIYLRMPRSGGGLSLYPPQTTRLRKINEIERFEPITVQSAPGDLIFFRSAVPHAVQRGSEPGARLTLSGCAAFEPPPAQGIRYWA